MERERIGLQLRALNNLIRRYFDSSNQRREIERVTGNNGWIIGYLANHAEQEIYQKDIEDHFTLNRSTVSKVLSLMERKELVRREPVAQDGRLKRIVLTEKALEIQEVMMLEGEKMEHALTEGFSEKELANLSDYLKRMKKNISNTQRRD